MTEPREPHVIQKTRHFKGRHPDRPETTYYAVGPAREGLEQAYADLNDFLDRGSLSQWVQELQKERDALLALGRAVAKAADLVALHGRTGGTSGLPAGAAMIDVLRAWEALPDRLRERLEEDHG